jgi:nucleotide-binding universal stress UspA family protein
MKGGAAVWIRRLLVPTDFSPTSDAALAYARDLADRYGASLQLLHVLEDPFVPGRFGSDDYLGEPPGVRTTILEDARARLARRLLSTGRAAFGTSGEVVFGRAAETIVDYAAGHGIDLIVMGTHGRTGMAHLLLGSVAERIVRTAPCPVLTVRSSRVCDETATASEPVAVAAVRS